MGVVVSLTASFLIGQVPVLALEEACTPTAGFTNCVRFTYSGANQTFTVPAGFVSGNFLHAEVWGAGGGGSTYMGAYTPNSGGGAGGYASTAILDVTAGDIFTVLVGQGGLSNSTSPAFGGGGLVGKVATGNGARGSGGGGMSGIFLDSQLNLPIQISGGGGGGSPGSNASGNPGGGGGTGNAPNPGGSEAGRPGTITSGGAGATVGSNCTQPPTSGSRYQGGQGAAPGEPGGGGGGGYFGGGGGACQTSGSVQNGGGGGGSGFVSTSRVIVLKSGNGGVGPLGGSGAVSNLGTQLHGSGGQYRSGVGVGGAGNTTANGGNGMVVFQWSTVPQPPSAANPDASSGKAATVQSIPAAQANDTLPVGFNWVVSSIRLCTQAEEQVSQPSRSCTVGNNIATRATASNEGQYRLNTTNGSISFTPDAGFSGTAVPITYQISDNSGRVFWSTYTPKVIGPPGTTSDTGLDSFGAIQTLQVLTNDQFDPGAPVNSSALKICTMATTLANCSLTTLQIANVGRFEVLSGAVKFTPCTANGSPFASPSCTQGYVGTSSIQYRIADSLGQTSTASVTVTTQPPAISAADQTKSVLPSSSVSFTALVGVPGLASGVGLSACLVSSGTSCVANNSFQISGQGTFNYDPNTKTVRFTALSTLTPGVSQSVVYKVTDAANQFATASLTVVAPLPPSLAPDSPYGAAGATQRIAVLANDSPGDATSPLLPTSLALCPSTSSLDAQCNLNTLTVQGQGTYSVASDGTIIFEPVAGFDGPVDQIKYVVSDSLGQIAGSTVSTTVLPPPAPAPQVDALTTSYGSTTTVRPLLNDIIVMPTSGYTQTGSAEIDASSLRLCGPSDSGSSCSETVVSTAAGTYALDIASGQISFTPALGFSGRDLNAPNYSVCVSISGAWSPATPQDVCSFGSLDATVASAPPPTAAADSSNGPLNTQLSIAVSANDSAAPGRHIEAGSVRLCSLGESNPANCSLTSLSTSDGVFSVDISTGRVSFDPIAGFTGPTPEIPYSVADNTGLQSLGTVQFESIAPAPAQLLSSTGLQDAEQMATVTIPQSGSVTLLDSQNNPASSVVVLGGRYSINTASGLITFTPDQGFVGQAPALQIQVLDRFGQETLSSYAATVTQTPPPLAPTVSSDSFSATVGSQIFGNVATNDTLPQNGTASVISQSLSGTLVFAVDGSFNYTPQAGFTGDEFFTYSVCHPAPNSAVCSTALAQLSFSVTQPSQPVAAAPSRPAPAIPSDPNFTLGPSQTTAQGLPVATPALEKPTELSSCLVDESGDCIALLVKPGVGSFETSPDHRVIFAPNAGFTGKAVIERRWIRGSDVLAVELLEFQVAPPIRIVPASIRSNQRAELDAGSALAGSRCLVQRADSACSSELAITGVGTWKISNKGLVTFAPVKTFIGEAKAWLRSSSGGTNEFVEYSIVVTPAKKRPPVMLVLIGFDDGSPTLTSKFRVQIRAFMAKHNDYSLIRCSGQTEGPTVLMGDRRLATQRANNACSYAMSLSLRQLGRMANGLKNHTIESPQLRRAIIQLSDD